MMWRLYSLLALLVLLGLIPEGQAQLWQTRRPSIGDPAVGWEYYHPGWSDMSGRTTFSPTLTGPTCIFIIAGQSTSASYAHDLVFGGTPSVTSPGQVTTLQGSSVYTVTNSTAQSMSIYDGQIYDGGDPVPGASRGDTANTSVNPTLFGGWNGRLADKLINDVANSGCGRVINIPTGIGSTSILQHQPNQGFFYRRLSRAWKLVQAQGWDSNINTTRFGIIWAQGQSDALAPFIPGGVPLTQAQYVSYFNIIKNALAAEGFNGKWFMPTTAYWLNNYNGTQACGAPITCSIYLPIYNAQTAASPAGIITGTDVISIADTDTLVPACDITCTTAGSITWRWDSVHLSTTGADKYACRMANTLGASISC